VARYKYVDTNPQYLSVDLPRCCLIRGVERGPRAAVLGEQVRAERGVNAAGVHLESHLHASRARWSVV
jgi:hypothetical protein